MLTDLFLINAITYLWFTTITKEIYLNYLLCSSLIPSTITAILFYLSHTSLMRIYPNSVLSKKRYIIPYF